MLVEIFTTGLLSVVLLLSKEKELSTQGMKKRNREKAEQKQNKKEKKRTLSCIKQVSNDYP